MQPRRVVVNGFRFLDGHRLIKIFSFHSLLAFELPSFLTMDTGETENRKKRQRIDNEDSVKRDGVEAMFRSTDLWFEDGNLILLVGSIET